MKFYLHNNGAQYRFLAVLLLAVFGISAASAQTSDEINAAILQEGSLPPTWTNDATHPWYISQNSDGIFDFCSSVTSEDSNYSSTISFSYTSSYQTEIVFEGFTNGDPLIAKLDGIDKIIHRSRQWHYFGFIAPAGSHTVEFTSTNLSASNMVAIRNLKLLECKELETACLKEGSLPLTFENDPNNMWITDNGYIRSNTQHIDGEVTSKITTTFTIDKVSHFTFEIRDQTGTPSDYKTNVYIDGELYTFASKNWQRGSEVLFPGTHTIEFENWSRNIYYDHVTEIRNVCLDQTLYEVTLNNPGELGVRLLQALGDKNLQDAELVKINGAMNSDDWGTVKQLSGVAAIDFTGTNITEIPDEGMRGLARLRTVVLPETLTKIGDNAFRETAFYEITIPASVESIGREAWRYSP